MSPVSIAVPFAYFTDTAGNPLDAGYVYVGVENMEPIANPVAVYWDPALTIPAAQPIRTTGGYLSRNGSAGALYANAAYSILVKDHVGRLIYSAASTPQLRVDLASTDVAKGDALITTKSTLTGGVARTQHDKNAEMVTPADFGALGDGATDDTAALIACCNSGATKINYDGLSYKITAPIPLYIDGVVHDLRGATITQATTNEDGFLLGWTGAAFAKTDNTVFLGGTIAGADDGAGLSASVGIAIQAPTEDPFVLGHGCSNTKIIGTVLPDWSSSIAATAADNTTLDDVTCTDMEYHAALGAGGYGALFQTCFRTTITDSCKFIGGANSRHAIYISADPSKALTAANTCQHVDIGACLIDWSAVSGVTEFEYAIQLRAPQNISILGTNIIGSWGGINDDLANGNADGLVIQGVSMSGIRAGAAGELAGIVLTRSAGAFRRTNAVVTGNNISIDAATTNCHGIQTAFIDNLTIGSNTISGTAVLSGVTVAGCTQVSLLPNTLIGNQNYGFVYMVGDVTDGITFHKQHTSGTGPAYLWTTYPTNSVFAYQRMFRVDSDGIGGVTVTVMDDDMVITAAGEANGVTVNFPAEVAVNDHNFLALAGSSAIANIYYRNTAAPLVANFGVLGITAGALAPINLAGAALSITFVILK